MKKSSVGKVSKEYPCSLTLLEGGPIDCNIEWEGDLGIEAQVAGPPDAWDPGEPACCEIIRITVSQNYPKLDLGEGDAINLAQVKEDRSKLENDILDWYASELASEQQEPDEGLDWPGWEL